MLPARQPLRLLLQRGGRCLVAGEAQAGAGPAGAAMASEALATGSISIDGRRYNHTAGSSYYMNLWARPSARLDREALALARSMLPHRSEFAPSFAAHGVQLLPERLPPAAAIAWDSLDDAPLDSAEAALQAASPTDDEEETAMYADSTKRKRRLKMKRHKHKKRMKSMRHRQ